MFTDSVSQELRQGTAGMSCAYSMISGASAEQTWKLAQHLRVGIIWNLHSHVWYLGWDDSKDEDCQLEHLPRPIHLAWLPCSTTDSGQLDLVWQGSKYMCSSEQNRSHIVFYDLVLEATQCHFWHVLFVEALTDQPRCKEVGYTPILWWEECHRILSHDFKKESKKEKLRVALW